MFDIRVFDVHISSSGVVSGVQFPNFEFIMFDIPNFNFLTFEFSNSGISIFQFPNLHL